MCIYVYMYICVYIYVYVICMCLYIYIYILSQQVLHTPFIDMIIPYICAYVKMSALRCLELQCWICSPTSSTVASLPPGALQQGSFWNRTMVRRCSESRSEVCGFSRRKAMCFCPSTCGGFCRFWRCYKILESTVWTSLEKGSRTTKSCMHFRCVHDSHHWIISRWLLCFAMSHIIKLSIFHQGSVEELTPFYLQSVLWKAVFLLRDSVHPRRVQDPHQRTRRHVLHPMDVSAVADQWQGPIEKGR